MAKTNIPARPRVYDIGMKKACIILDLSESYIRDLTDLPDDNEKKLPCIRDSENRRLFAMADLEAFNARRANRRAAVA
jgi:hypothetical protein